MKFKVALLQMEVSREKEKNLEKIAGMCREAASRGVKLVVAPEYAMASLKREEMPIVVAEDLQGSFVKRLREIAREHEVYLVVGIYEKAAGEKAHSTAVMINPEGEIIATYRKLHLYDAMEVKESEKIIAGDDITAPVKTELGMIGMEICYDLRFPEITRILALKGADIIAVSSAWFAGPLKEEHWLTLLKVRALENGVYMLGANQTGRLRCGRSAVVDPMGVVVAEAGEEEKVLVAEVDLERMKRVKELLPVLKHRRSDVYSLSLGGLRVG